MQHSHSHHTKTIAKHVRYICRFLLGTCISGCVNLLVLFLLLLSNGLNRLRMGIIRSIKSLLLLFVDEIFPINFFDGLKLFGVFDLDWVIVNFGRRSLAAYTLLILSFRI